MIKNMRLSFKLSQELKKSTTQQKYAIQKLRDDKEEMKKQNLVCETLDAKIRFLTFKESIPLYSKECKIILFVCILISGLQSTCAIANFIWWKSEMVDFIMLLGSTMWLGAVLVVLIIAGMCIKLTKKLKKTLQQLEEAIRQRDHAIRIKNAEGEQNDE
ncbi:hypothetical protein [Bartonella rattimassiliensis]|uniref:hypothetical protein n=1 Tax=Bartonella rattimassiliensis TaxID=270250 RepID=UPI001FCBB71E|nr:hypothetical protein [Bartonella rattimassiliensis]